MDKEIQKLKRIQLLQTVAIIGLAIACFKIHNTKELSVDELKTKSLIVTDTNGLERLEIGFPIQNSSFRLRKDSLNGIVMLDSAGMDRIHLGEHGKLFLGGKYYNRTNPGYSLFFNDPKGEERSGYGFSDDDNSVGLGMDYGGENGGEAIYLYAAPNIAFMTLNADLQDKPGIRDRIVLWHETDKDLSLIKLSDSTKDGKILLSNKSN